jgi:hypothetical protein
VKRFAVPHSAVMHHASCVNAIFISRNDLRASPSQAIGLRSLWAGAPHQVACVKRFAVPHNAVMRHASCMHARFISCNPCRASPSQAIGLRSPSAGAPRQVACVKRFAIMHNAVMHHPSCMHARFISRNDCQASPSQAIGLRSPSAGAPLLVNSLCISP